MKNDTNSLLINMLRPFLLLIVIINHCTLDYGQIMGETSHLGGAVFQVIQVFLGKTITPSAVNCFFLISGFLFFLKSQGTQIDLKQKLRKRFHSLLVPYLIWNVLGIVCLILLAVLKGNGVDDFTFGRIVVYLWCSNVWSEDTVNLLGWPTPMYGPIDIPLWYLRDLIVVTLFSPLIYRILRLLRYKFLLLVGLLYVLNIWTSLPGFSIDSLFYWSVGAYLSMNNKGFFPLFTKGITFLVIVVTVSILPVVTWLMVVREHIVLTGLLQRILTMGLICVYIQIFGYFAWNRKQIKVPEFILTSCFFVYAIHDFPRINPIGMVRSLCSNMLRDNLQIIIYLITPIMVYVLSLMLYIITKRFMPKICTILSGGRG